MTDTLEKLSSSLASKIEAVELLAKNVAGGGDVSTAEIEKATAEAEMNCDAFTDRVTVHRRRGDLRRRLAEQDARRERCEAISSEIGLAKSMFDAAKETYAETARRLESEKTALKDVLTRERFALKQLEASCTDPELRASYLAATTETSRLTEWVAKCQSNFDLMTRFLRKATEPEKAAAQLSVDNAAAQLERERAGAVVAIAARDVAYEAMLAS